VPSEDPSPVVNVNPDVPFNDKVPLAVLKVTCNAPVASTSLTAIALPLAVEKTSAVSSLVD